ncbi:hypothetical protein N0V85_006590 [Neurospora sp. IMI 360204]|nr:hypothetical protein N0V85_006590 [Neurospora sp. IMI 360204]
MSSNIAEEVIQTITGQLFQGIDNSEHNMIPAVMQQKVAKELKNVLRNASISGGTSLRNVALSPSSSLAPAGDNNAGEAQDDTAAP